MTGFRGDIGPPPLSGAHRITMWAPGTEIRFEKPLSLAFFVRLPMTLAVLAGPAMWVSMGRRHVPDLKGQLIVSVVVAIVGFWLGRSNFAAALRALPERITFDLRSGRFRISGYRRPMEMPLSAITAIEVRGVIESRSSRAESDMHSTPYYKCLLQAHSRASGSAPARTLDLAETEFVANDPATSMREASTVASELAAALGVEHRVTDFPPR